MEDLDSDEPSDLGLLTDHRAQYTFLVLGDYP